MIKINLKDQYFINSFWLLSDKIIRILVAVFVNIWMARHLGPKDFGLFNYVITIASIFYSFSTLGLDTILTRELINNPDEKQKLISTSFKLLLIGNISWSLLAIISNYWINANDTNTYLLICLLSLANISQAFNVIDYYFQSISKPIYSIIPSNVAILIGGLLKITAILNNASIAVFIYISSIELIITAVFLGYSFFFKERSFKIEKFDLQVAKYLLKDSWHLMLASLGIMLYMRIDQVMIKSFLGNIDLGLYTASVKISEMWYFIPTAIVTAYFPRLVSLQKSNKIEYYDGLLGLLSALTWLGILISIFICFFKVFVTNLIYGQNFLGASNTLMVNVWCGIFVSQGLVRGKWLVIENLQRYATIYILLGAVINIILNTVLINKLGILGAALSTLISQALVAIVFPAFFKDTRVSSLLIIKSFNPIHIAKLKFL